MRLQSFFSLLVDCLKEGLGCIHYHQIKRDELFLYLRAGYTKEELALFFYPVLGQNLEFKDFVLMNSRKIFDVKDFALQANMSQSTFNRRFKETFNETAKNWLLLRKQEFVKRDVALSNLSFSEIAENISSLQLRIWLHSVKNILERLLIKYEKKQLEKLYRLTRIIG